MSNDPNPKKYDLEERTAKFGEDIIKFCQKVPKNEVTRPLISQLVDCGTSAGANYCEADDAVSKKDFKNKNEARSAIIMAGSERVKSNLQFHLSEDQVIMGFGT